METDKIDKGKWLVGYIADYLPPPGEFLHQVENLTRPELDSFLREIKRLKELELKTKQ